MTTDNTQTNSKQILGICLPAATSFSLAVIGWIVLVFFYLASPLSSPFPKLRAILIIICWCVSALIAGISFFKKTNRSPLSRLLLITSITISLGSLLVCAGPIIGHLKRVQYHEQIILNSIRQSISSADKCIITENLLMQTKPSRNQYTAPVSIAEEILAIASLHIEKITPDTALSLAHRYDLTLSENGKDIYTIQFDRMTDTKFEHNIISYFGTASSERGVIKLTNEGGQRIEKLIQEVLQSNETVNSK